MPHFSRIRTVVLRPKGLNFLILRKGMLGGFAGVRKGGRAGRGERGQEGRAECWGQGEAFGDGTMP